MSHIQNTKIKKFHEEWAVKNGYRPQAASVKPEDLHAANNKRHINYKKFEKMMEAQLQAPSFKRQAPKDTSRKLQAPSLSSKRQASSRKRQAP